MKRKKIDTLKIFTFPSWEHNDKFSHDVENFEKMVNQMSWVSLDGVPSRGG